MSGHTPGPWRVVGNDFMTLVASTDDAGVAMVYTGEEAHHGAQGDANARLIAAAPEMLALVRLVAHVGAELEYGECVRVRDQDIEAARALLARIGEGEP